MTSKACLAGAVGGVAVRAVWLWWSASLGSRPRLARSLCQIVAAYALRLNSQAGTEGSTVSSLICDRWLILGLETLNISRCLNHWWQMAFCCMPGRSSMALFTRTTELDPGTHGARCAWAMAYTHHQVSLMVSRNTTLVPSLVLRIGLACEAGLSAGMRRERVPPQIRKKERRKEWFLTHISRSR